MEVYFKVARSYLCFIERELQILCLLLHDELDITPDHGGGVRGKKEGGVRREGEEEEWRTRWKKRENMRSKREGEGKGELLDLLFPVHSLL